MLTSDFFILSEMCRMNQHLCHHNEVKRKEVNKPLSGTLTILTALTTNMARCPLRYSQSLLLFRFKKEKIPLNISNYR